MMFPHGEQSFPSFYLYIECQRSLVIALLGFGKPCLAFTLRIIPYSPVVCKGGFQTFFCLVTVASAALACPCLKGKCLTARPHRVEIVNKSASSRPRVNDFFPGRLAMLYAQSLLLYPTKFDGSCEPSNLGPKFNCQRTMSIPGLGSRFNLPWRVRQTSSRLNAAHYIIFCGRL